MKSSCKEHMTGRFRFCHWLKRLKHCHPSHGYLLVDFISVLNSLSFFVWEIWDNTANVCQVIKNSRLDRNGLFGVSLSLQINNSFLPSLQVEAHNSALSHLLVCSGEISPTSNRIRDPRRTLYHEPFDWGHVCFSFFLFVQKKHSPLLSSLCLADILQACCLSFHVAYPQRAIKPLPFTFTLSVIKNMAGKLRGAHAVSKAGAPKHSITGKAISAFGSGALNAHAHKDTHWYVLTD